jgi:hypothetical protein
MRIKADLYSGRLFEYWEPKKRDHQALPFISHRDMKINTATGVSTRHKSYNDDERRHRDQNEKYKSGGVSGANLRDDDRPCRNPPYAKPDRPCMRLSNTL